MHMLIIKIHSINMLHLRMRYILRFWSQYAPQAAHADHQDTFNKYATFAHADHQNTFNQYVTFANALHFKIPVTVCTSGCTC